MRIIFFVVFTFFIVSFQNCAFANVSIDQINVGGEAICKLKKKFPLKRIKFDGNRLLILQEDGVNKGSFQLQ